MVHERPRILLVVIQLDGVLQAAVILQVIRRAARTIHDRADSGDLRRSVLSHFADGVVDQSIRSKPELNGKRRSSRDKGRRRTDKRRQTGGGEFPPLHQRIGVLIGIPPESDRLQTAQKAPALQFIPVIRVGSLRQVDQVGRLSGGYIDIEVRIAVPSGGIALVVKVRDRHDKVIAEILIQAVELGEGFNGVAAVEELTDGPAAPIVRVRLHLIAVAQINPAVLVYLPEVAAASHICVRLVKEIVCNGLLRCSNVVGIFPFILVVERSALLVHHPVIEIIGNALVVPDDNIIAVNIVYTAGGGGRHAEVHRSGH